MSNVYSEWMRVDLHIHTSHSKITKKDDYKGEFSVQLTKSKLLESQVSIFALTDHNIINTQAYEEYYRTQETGDPLLLLGVELDIEVDGPDGKLRTYHSLLIFNISNADGVNRISECLEKAYKTYNISNPFERKLTIGQIVEIFPEEDFFFIPHAGSSKSIVKGYHEQVEHAQRMVLLMQSAFEKVPEKARIKYNDGFNRVLETEFQSRDDIAYIDFSDNHNISRYPKPNMGDGDDDHVFSYIKGSKSYESIRLAFIDPKSRIMSETQVQALPKSINEISSLQIVAHKSMTESKLFFSPHLNVIIGGRSSGKSLLMYLLGEKTSAGGKGSESSYSEVVDLDEVKIKTKLDHEYKSAISIGQSFVYINQGDIVRYFENRELDSLAKKSGKGEDYNGARRALTSLSQTLKTTIGLFTERYRGIHEKGRRSFILHDATIQHLFSQSYLLFLDRNRLNARFNIIASLQTSLDLVSDVEENVEKLLNDKNLAFTVDERRLVEDFEVLIAGKPPLLRSLSETATRQIKFIEEISSLVSDINNSQSEEAQAKQSSQSSKDELIREIGTYLGEMRALATSARSLEDFAYRSLKKVPLSESIDLVIEVPDLGSIRDHILDGIKGAVAEESLFSNSLRLLRGNVTLKNYGTNSPGDLEKKISSQLSELVAGMERPEDYLGYEGGETSKNKSPGFNSEKYLEIALQNPRLDMIFIDQPEDNLGNKFIADSLVKIIREIKFKKQIFLVTHNPSVVVYGDAESIIVAQNLDGQISYSQIVLEDEDSQRLICGILDGGEYIFDNRSRKYNIKRLLKERKRNVHD